MRQEERAETHAETCFRMIYHTGVSGVALQHHGNSSKSRCNNVWTFPLTAIASVQGEVLLR